MAGGKVWTEAEDEIVRDTWASKKLMKECLAQLPGRTEKAVMVRVRALGLGPRVHMDRSGKSVILRMVLAEMARGSALSSRDISEKFGCTAKHASDLLREAHDSKKIRVQAWQRSRPGGCYMALYAHGDGEDAVRPSPKSEKDRNRTRYVNRRIREGKLHGNVFAVAMAQVMDLELPKANARASRGKYESRVYIQEAA